MTGMTFTNAFTGKPEAPHHTMLLNSFDGVLRTGRLKPTARTEQWAYEPLVESDAADRYCTQRLLNVRHK